MLGPSRLRRQRTGPPQRSASLLFVVALIVGTLLGVRIPLGHQIGDAGPDELEPGVGDDIAWGG